MFNDAVQVLLVFPSKELQEAVQEHLVNIEDDINIYCYERTEYAEEDLDWLLTVFKLSELTIIDIDNVCPYLQDLLSYMIAKPKTFWLTKGENVVYNKLSNNRVNDFKFLSNLGGNFETS